jgi:cysteine-rich repeat protein
MPKPARLAVAVGVLVLLGVALSARAANGSCGNGVLDVGEECDDGNLADGDCCSATCTYEPSGTLCTPDGVICTFDVCDGAGACTHPLRPQGSPCEANDDLCSKEECDGAGSCVPAGPLVCDACSTCFAAGGCTGVPRTVGQGPGECHGPGGPSTLKVTNPADASRSRLDVKLTAFGPASFGDPTDATDYQLCVFQGRNSIAPVSAAAGAAWKPSRSGFTYRLDDAGALRASH